MQGERGEGKLFGFHRRTNIGVMVEHGPFTLWYTPGFPHRGRPSFLRSLIVVHLRTAHQSLRLIFRTRFTLNETGQTWQHLRDKVFVPSQDQSGAFVRASSQAIRSNHFILELQVLEREIPWQDRHTPGESLVSCQSLNRMKDRVLQTRIVDYHVLYSNNVVVDDEFHNVELG
uniref:Uncharacterized protein n=2 Tax=Cacopsylla melanoneura TaxID=428564 RepID=A0A8D8RU13_9HEMI